MLGGLHNNSRVDYQGLFVNADNIGGNVLARICGDDSGLLVSGVHRQPWNPSFYSRPGLKIVDLANSSQVLARVRQALQFSLGFTVVSR